jgi:hypothetical protein
LLVSALVWPLAALGQAATRAGRIDAMRFSAMKAGELPAGELRPWAFAGSTRPTRYSLVADGGSVVLRADAEASASGIVRELSVDPRTHPIVEWRWKVMNLVERGDLYAKAGDDYSARVYVTFELDSATLPPADRVRLAMARLVHGEIVPAAALCYVWDRKAARDTIAANAYTDRVRMIVAESGPARVGQWVGIRRNLREDYRRAFGGEPSAVTGVVVSTDTDNTGEVVVAYYGDIAFGSS